MISRETIETFAKTTVDALARRGVRRDDWKDSPDAIKAAHREAVTEAFKTIGVKVEGDGEVKF